MDRNDQIKQYSEHSKNRLLNWVSNLTENQKEVLNRLEMQFNRETDSFTELEKERLEDKLDGHISSRAKIEVLEKEHAAIINDPDFISHYRDILLPGNLINNEKYPEFAYHFGFLGFGFDEVNELQEIEAQEYLNCVATLNLIEYFLSLLDPPKDWYNENIFTDRSGHALFDNIFHGWLCEETTINAIWYVFRRFWIKNTSLDEFQQKLPYCTIQCTALEFAKHWNKVYKPQHFANFEFKYSSKGTVQPKSFDQIGESSCSIFHKKLMRFLPDHILPG